MTTLALGSFFRRRATSSPTRLQALSKRPAPTLLYPHSPTFDACGGGAGCSTSTLVVALVRPPCPSSAVHVTVYLPAARPVESNCTVGPEPMIWPPVVE